ncbi:PepSY-associated TM helix domain-containing protein [Azohydromonas aeria]|uniref:PepSY-associated TM helix domain-containing protein n=1 Tax=Azohydromonas aeria TaxID=2590212 RepID=UPI0012F8B7FE|nr:PepSY-associated TM helix domain-containing protein [Azohydromonas aeria]
MRAAAVIVHRYVGLVMAGFLLIAGLTGSLLVWYHELDAAVNPALFRVEPPRATPGGSAGPLLDPLMLRAQVQEAYPGAQVNYLSFHQGRPEDARLFYVEAATAASEQSAELAVDEVFVNPYTGEILGARKWGDITQGITNLMPFLYRLHYSLALGTVGTWIFGIVALLWTIDCFVGAWLTFPVSPRKGTRANRSWWVRWQPAWAVRWRGGSYKLNFDLHRAGGLWPWAMLLVVAWSSVAFNLYAPLYRPLMGAVFQLQPDPKESLAALDEPEPEPALGWPAAIALAREHMALQARLKGFTVLEEDRVSYDPKQGYLRYVVRTDRDISDHRGQSALFVDARTGKLSGTVLPTGEAAGDTVTSWITTLHMAHVWGLPFRIFMTLVGLLVAVVSVTGVVVWWKKRLARVANAGRQQTLSHSRPGRGSAL